jgi:hypothetical protein
LDPSPNAYQSDMVCPPLASQYTAGQTLESFPHFLHRKKVVVFQKLYHGAQRDISGRYSTILDKYLWEDDEGGYNFREDGGGVEENSLEETTPKPTKKPAVEKVELPWRKRLKFQEFDFFVLFVVVTGIPLMWTLGALLVT